VTSFALPRVRADPSNQAADLRYLHSRGYRVVIDSRSRDRRLLALEEQQRGEVSRLQSARERRGKALVSLETESKSRAKELERLKDQQGGLEKLVRELRRALERIEKFPTDSKDAFARLRGKLAWPVAGKLIASYGQVRAGGMKWDGVLLAGAQGTPSVAYARAGGVTESIRDGVTDFGMVMTPFCKSQRMTICAGDLP